jgi:predicted MFS family arabinose efflux permease
MANGPFYTSLYQLNNDMGLRQRLERSAKPPHPILFFFFYLPFGIFTGYLTVTLTYLFSRSGISIQQIAGLAAINLVPQIFKFIWAPLVDTTLSLKKWYLVSALLTAAAIFGTGIVPINVSNLFLFSCMILVCSFARSFMSAAINGLAAHEIADEQKGRVGGYNQAGNLGGGAIGGGAGLWLAQHTRSVWMPSASISLICILCCASLLYIKEPVSTIRTMSRRQTARNVLTDIWQTLKTRRGLLALILNFLPLGTGAAGFLFAGIANDWHAGADTVALVTGGLGGTATILGCLAGGRISDRINKQRAFVLFSLLQALCCIAMAFCPHTRSMYVVWTLIYALVNGFVNGAYAAFCLEASGTGAAASKYEIYASAAYLPLYFMFWVSGAVYNRWGPSRMLNVEAAVALAAATIYFSAKGILSRSRDSKILLTRKQY